MIVDQVFAVVSESLKSEISNAISGEAFVSERRYKKSPEFEEINELDPNTMWAWVAIEYRTKKIYTYVGVHIEGGVPYIVVAFAGIDRKLREKLMQTLRKANLNPNWDGYEVIVRDKFDRSDLPDVFDHKLLTLLKTTVAAIQKQDPFGCRKSIDVNKSVL